MTADMKNFYLNTPLGKGKEEYMRIQIKTQLEEIIEECELKGKEDEKGLIYMQICKGMYGLPQAGILANELLQTRLNKEEYVQSEHVPGLWKHTTDPLKFTLVVDDFGIHYIDPEYAKKLIKVL